MKTIYIATDSRGSIGPVTPKDPQARKTSWTEEFKEKYPGNNYICRRSALEIPTHHIYDSELLHKYDDNTIDLAILHTGMYSGIDYCTPPVFKALFGKYYFEEGLKYPQPNDRFIYSHAPSEEEIFALVRRKCKRSVWIGLHNLSRWHLELRGSREWNPTYVELANIQNKWYSSLVTDYLDLPQDEQWVDQSCYPNEFLHYIGPGVQYILDKLNPIMQQVLKD